LVPFFKNPGLGELLGILLHPEDLISDPAALGADMIMKSAGYETGSLGLAR
jgi:hypothetical protein